MKRPAFLSGFLMMLVGLGLTIAVMFVLPFHKDAAAPCFYLVRMTAVLGFASALAGVMLQFSSAGLAAGIQLMNMLLGIVITLAAAFFLLTDGDRGTDWESVILAGILLFLGF